MEQKCNASHQLQHVGQYTPVHRAQCGAEWSPGFTAGALPWAISYLHLISPPLTEQSPPIHWHSGCSPLVLFHAHWPRFEVQVGSIYLSCALPHLEKGTRLPNKDTGRCPSRMKCRSMPRISFPIWTERNPSVFSLCLLQLLAPVNQRNTWAPCATLLHCLSALHRKAQGNQSHQRAVKLQELCNPTCKVLSFPILWLRTILYNLPYKCGVHSFSFIHSFIHSCIHSLLMNSEFYSLAVSSSLCSGWGDFPLLHSSCFIHKAVWMKNLQEEKSCFEVFVWTSHCLDLDLVQTMWLKAHD